MAGSECTGATASLRATDGSLWFPTLSGVVVMDPQRLRRNDQAPTVFVQSMLVDDAPIDSLQGQEITVQPGQHRYAFDYTALSLFAPANVKFRYRIEGFDRT